MRQPDKVNFLNIIIRKALIIVFWLLVWLFLALWVGNDIILASPIAAIRSLLSAMLQADFWKAVGGSLIRIIAGFTSGFIVAVILAVLSAGLKPVEELLAPVMDLCKAVPVASFVVLFLIWWGSSFLAVAVSFMVVLPNVYVNTLEGIKNADDKLLEMAKVFRMPLKSKLFYIYRPAVRPFLTSALKVSAGMSWKSGVAAEIIGTPAHSIGNGLYMSKIVLDTAGVFSWTFVVIILSFICEKAVLRLCSVFFEYEPVCNYKNTMSEVIPKSSIKWTDVRKSYGGQRVLDDVSLLYEAGKVYYLTGPSGSGKTTRMRIMCGLELPDGGDMDGHNYFTYAFQEDRLCEDYSAIKNVAMVTGDERKAKEALLKLLPEEALSKPCRELSGGMKRRVAVVRAMEAPGTCVLLDEPYTGMDAVTKENTEKYIFDRQDKRTLIISTHI